MVAVAVAAVDQFLIIALAADDAGFGQPGGQHTLREYSRERAEQIARAEMKPDGMLPRIIARRAHIVLRQAIAFPGKVLRQLIQRKFHDPRPLRFIGNSRMR